MCLLTDPPSNADTVAGQVGIPLDEDIGARHANHAAVKILARLDRDAVVCLA